MLTVFAYLPYHYMKTECFFRWKFPNLSYIFTWSKRSRCYWDSIIIFIIYLLLQASSGYTYYDSCTPCYHRHQYCDYHLKKVCTKSAHYGYYSKPYCYNKKKYYCYGRKYNNKSYNLFGFGNFGGYGRHGLVRNILSKLY